MSEDDFADFETLMSNNDKSLDVVDVGAIISPSDSTILNALEAADVHIHYHCRLLWCMPHKAN